MGFVSHPSASRNRIHLKQASDPNPKRSKQTKGVRLKRTMSEDSWYQIQTRSGSLETAWGLRKCDVVVLCTIFLDAGLRILSFLS